jgi:hypothetical protein
LGLLDEEEFAQNRHPGSEFKSAVFVGVGSVITSWFRYQPDRPCLFDLSLSGEDETYKPGLFSNPIEFDGVKPQVVQALPYSQKLNGIAITQPVLNNVIGSFRVPVTSNIS